MNRHAWREVRRQIRESGGAGVVAVLLVTFATALGGTLVTVRRWVDAQLMPGERPATVVAVVEPASAADSVGRALNRRFPDVAGGPVAPAAVRDQLAGWFPEFASLFTGLAESSFPALLELEVDAAADSQVVDWLRQREEVVLVESSRRWQEQLDRTAWRVLWAGFGVAGVLLLGCSALVLLVVRLLVLDHTDEIAIMRLIGAHEREIKQPYFLCGTFLGALGGLVGGIVLAAGLLAARRFLPGVEVDALVLAVLPFIGAGAATLGAAFGLASLPSEP